MPVDDAEQFLESLYEQARQDGEDPQEVAQRVYQNVRGVDRRELLAGAGALGLGGLMGGAGTVAATQRASADPSTSDSDGNVGTPSDPVDVFADGTEYQDSSSDPSSNGQLQRNGSDVKVHSGGSVRNLSNVSGGVSAHASTHENGGSDEVIIENLPANSTDTSLAFKPDGSGGVQAASVSSGGASDFAKVDLGSNQSISENSLEKVTLDSETYDTGNNFDTTNNNYTAPSAGKYHVKASLRWADGAYDDTKLVTYIYKNGNVELRHLDVFNESSVGVDNDTVVSSVLDLASNDTVDIRAFQSGSGGSMDLLSGPGTRVEIYKVA